MAICAPSPKCVPKISSTRSGVPRNETSLILVMRSWSWSPGWPGNSSIFSTLMPPFSALSSSPAPWFASTRRVKVSSRNEVPLAPLGPATGYPPVTPFPPLPPRVAAGGKLNSTICRSSRLASAMRCGGTEPSSPSEATTSSWETTAEQWNFMVQVWRSRRRVSTCSFDGWTGRAIRSSIAREWASVQSLSNLVMLPPSVETQGWPRHLSNVNRSVGLTFTRARINSFA
mmetsp:Transcript_25461/g.73526  ORF Transcript_25461/g.73526 Transcript_25461/m.73526 type:complete len:229 (+) Transcript_25461:108-794(+)